ncbi:hypothetical protein PIB30_068573 [Stylosanthes scabra]|uniref:Uncharacterized protein n=1 Tax=Stylosanthes scabra TaxID=79078 RepID=A0ABU6WLA0_9FABA|nr:hypothetical protein [Stylosanthes scabra]
MCEGDEVKGKRASGGVSEGEDKVKGIEGEGRKEEDPAFGHPQEQCDVPIVGSVDKPKVGMYKSLLHMLCLLVDLHLQEGRE